MEYEPRYVHQYNNESVDAHTIKKINRQESYQYQLAKTRKCIDLAVIWRKGNKAQNKG